MTTANEPETVSLSELGTWELDGFRPTRAQLFTLDDRALRVSARKWFAQRGGVRVATR